MYNDNRFIILIPARGGSKGIPNKNIINVKGRPLIDFTISEALKSKYADKIVVSTDSHSIAKIAKDCGADVPFLRPIELATDKSKTINTVTYTLEKLKESGQQFDYVVLLQPTQPLRKSFHIDEAIELIVEKKEQSLASVSLVKDHPILMRTINEQGQLVNLLKENSTVRRQDFSTYYKINGSIYINKIDANLNVNTSLNDNSVPYIMDEQYDLDIDEPFDLEVLKLLKNYSGEDLYMPEKKQLFSIKAMKEKINENNREFIDNCFIPFFKDWNTKYREGPIKDKAPKISIQKIKKREDLKFIGERAVGFYVILTDYIESEWENRNVCKFTLQDKCEVKAIYRGETGGNGRERLESHLFKKQYDNNKGKKTSYSVCLKLKQGGQNGQNIDEDEKLKNSSWYVAFFVLSGSDSTIRKLVEKAFDEVYEKPICSRENYIAVPNR
ncbi:acylneuraminate cytidylyltransferase family protein [Gracilibacillus sp. S3-1-1]|uniref:Acylneuraminate cytidylyltransferase family protein n=1 Tax=Gracilibacillus pellucidus TaxID=3095368 RepID=A0ACC6M0Z1_9BACI|nr:acylneuraminate cytidylyltransferase family protein [Gracilibacillus sp. S3-1-1]MDX8044610.1 acylneuraminate cytidylyltransferase family protein [Gracilibacillus sp. S3-1-1]